MLQNRIPMLHGDISALLPGQCGQRHLPRRQEALRQGRLGILPQGPRAGMEKKAGPRLRDSTCWLYFVKGMSSRNLGPTFWTVLIQNHIFRNAMFEKFPEGVKPADHRGPIQLINSGSCFGLTHNLSFGLRFRSVIKSSEMAN